MKTINLKEKIYITADTVIAFHIGCGSRSHNPGYRTVSGEFQIGSFTESLFLQDDGTYTDCAGNSVGLTSEDVSSGIGRIELDGDYDTTYTLRLGDADMKGKEGDAVRNTLHDNRGDRWVAEQMVIWACRNMNETEQAALLKDLGLENEED